MNIETLSMSMAQNNISQDAGVKVQRMILDQARAQGEALTTLMGTAAPLTDSRLGNFIDMSA